MKMFLLLFGALFLFIIIAPIGFIWQLIRHSAAINEYLFRIAVCIDQAGNVICCQLFDNVLIKKNGYKFGDEKETISSVIGKNKQTGTLTKAGNFIYSLLDSIQKNHAENAIDNTINNKSFN